MTVADDGNGLINVTAHTLASGANTMKATDAKHSVACVGFALHVSGTAGAIGLGFGGVEKWRITSVATPGAPVVNPPRFRLAIPPGLNLEIIAANATTVVDGGLIYDPPPSV
jgi:hypothetical protein